MNLYLVRHGNSAANVNWTVLKTTKDQDVELTDLGKKQALEAGENLKALKIKKPVFIVSSWKRTRQTYNEIAKAFDTKQHVLFTPLIKEHERNLTDSANWDKIEAIRTDQRDYQKFKDVEFKGGETLQNVFERAREFLNVLERSTLENVVVISHGQFLKMLLSLIDGVDPNDSKHLHNCEIAERVI